MSAGVDGFALTTTEAWFDTDLPDRAPDPDALAAEWVRRVPVFGPHREDLSRLLGVGLFTGKILGAHRVAVLAALARDDEDATDRLYHGTLFTGLMPADFEARDTAGLAAELRERVGGEQLPGVLEIGDVLLGGIPAVRHRTLDTIPSLTPEQGTLVDTVKYFVPVPDGGDKLVLLWFATPTLGPEGDGMIELMDEVAATFRWLP
ncbi:MAG: hypothetical protein ACJ73S_32935 [Mycobacteriales bacterium]